MVDFFPIRPTWIGGFGNAKVQLFYVLAVIFFDVFWVFMAICFFITFNALKENDIHFEGFVFLAGWVGLAVKYVIDSGLMLKCGRGKGW